MVIVTAPCVTVVTPPSADAMEIVKFSSSSVKSSLKIGTLMPRYTSPGSKTESVDVKVKSLFNLAVPSKALNLQNRKHFNEMK